MNRLNKVSITVLIYIISINIYLEYSSTTFCVIKQDLLAYNCDYFYYKLNNLYNNELYMIKDWTII